MRHALSLDSTALQALESVLAKARRNGTQLILSGVHSQPLIVMERAGFLEKLGPENIHGNIDDALNRARDLLGLPRITPPGPFVPTVRREEK